MGQQRPQVYLWEVMESSWGFQSLCHGLSHLIITTLVRGRYQSYYKRKKNGPEWYIDSRIVVDSASRTHIPLNDVVLRGSWEAAGGWSPASVAQKANSSISPSSSGSVMSPKFMYGKLNSQYDNVEKVRGILRGGSVMGLYLQKQTDSIINTKDSLVWGWVHNKGWVWPLLFIHPATFEQLFLCTHVHRYFCPTWVGVARRPLSGTGIMLCGFPAFRAVSHMDFRSWKTTQFLALCYNRKQTKTHYQRTSNDDGEVACLCWPAPWTLAICVLEHQKYLIKIFT